MSLGESPIEFRRFSLFRFDSNPIGAKGKAIVDSVGWVQNHIEESLETTNFLQLTENYNWSILQKCNSAVILQNDFKVYFTFCCCCSEAHAIYRSQIFRLSYSLAMTMFENTWSLKVFGWMNNHLEIHHRSPLYSSSHYFRLLFKEYQPLNWKQKLCPRFVLNWSYKSPYTQKKYLWTQNNQLQSFQRPKRIKLKNLYFFFFFSSKDLAYRLAYTVIQSIQEFKN